MSQTETILLVVLGFSLAALIALFIGRFVWAMGLQLGARRMQKQVPSTLVGLQTERDRLRAEFAMLSQRMNARLETIKLQAAEQRAEVTRHRNRTEVLAAEIAALKTELETKESELVSLRHALSERRDTFIALPVEPAVEWMPAPDSPQERLKRRIDELTNLSRAIAENKDQIAAGVTPEPDPVIIEKLSAAARETADLQKELERLDAEWSKRLAEIGPELTDDGTVVQGKPGAVANVISLANRIRALKKEVNS